MHSFYFHFFRFPLRYFTWHYGRGVLGVVTIWVRLFWFVWNFFGISFLLSTFFEPWSQAPVHSESGADRWVAARITNSIMRAVGALARSVLLVAGLLSLLGLFCAGPIALCLWILLPFLVYALFLLGLLFLAYVVTQ